MADQYIINTFVPGAGWTYPDMTLAPGEGVIFRTGTTVTKSFVGELAQAYRVNPIPNGNSVRSSIVAQAGRVVRVLGLPAVNGDTVSLMVSGAYQNYTFNGSYWYPSEPIVAMGESFWNNKAVGVNWSRNFLIWP